MQYAVYLPTSLFRLMSRSRRVVEYVPKLTSVVGLTDIGQMRSRNEDSVHLVPERGIAVVADGMGGHPGGDVASQIAAQTAAEFLGASIDERSDLTDTPDALGVMMTASVAKAHEGIRARGEEEPELEGMGTTLTAMIVDPDTGVFALGHVGDSRAYLLRDGTLTQITRDDTWVQDRVEARQLTPEQARRHPFGHLLTQCLGLEDPPVPHVHIGSAEDGDVYLLCTDGLVGMVDDDRLREILVSQLEENGEGASEAPLRALISAANEAGGHDNITAALIRIGADD